MAKGKRKAAAGDVATNRQASYRYHLTDRYEAGIQLQGSEVKSLRAGRVQLKDGYAALSPDGEVWLHNVHIAPYEPASRENHDAERPRQRCRRIAHREAYAALAHVQSDDSCHAI
jgi:SsrA-binding protein